MRLMQATERTFPKKLVNYFRPRFLEIIVYGHSYVVSDGRYRMPRELDLNTLFGVPRKRGREKDVSLFQRLDTAYRVQHRMDAAERAGKTLSLTSIARQVSKRIHCGERTARDQYREFANILKIFDQDRFFEWKKNLKSEYAIFRERLKKRKAQETSGKIKRRFAFLDAFYRSIKIAPRISIVVSTHDAETVPYRCRGRCLLAGI